MPGALLTVSSKKLEKQSRAVGHVISRIYVNDDQNHVKFLVDTGADVSTIPPTHRERKAKPITTMKLYAANGSEIQTYGNRRMIVNLGLRRAFEWNFIVADIKTPLLGVDFLKAYNLLIDPRGERLIDQTTQLQIKAISTDKRIEVKTYDARNEFASLLEDFKEITVLGYKKPSEVLSPVTHTVITDGAPVFAHVRSTHFAVSDPRKQKKRSNRDSMDRRYTKSVRAMQEMSNRRYNFGTSFCKCNSNPSRRRIRLRSWSSTQPK